jgi:hypothetical protein
MATPHVAGGWAILKQACPLATVTEAFNALQNTGAVIDAYGCFGAGTYPQHRIRINTAIDALCPLCSGESFTIFNDGSGTLEVTSVDKPSWAQLSPPLPYSIVGGGSRQVCVTVDCAACGGSDLNGSLVVYSNDPDEPMVNVSITVICPRELLSCDPEHCNIDARIAHDRLDQNIKKNANTIVMNFSKPTTGMTAADFEVTLVPVVPGDVIPGISAVTPNVVDPKITTVALNKRFQQTRWTCIRDKGSNRRCCVASLPGDADNSRITRSDDIFEVFDNLAGLVSPTLDPEKCDTDRSLNCTPADLLMVVDLLNGADAFDEVNGDMLPLFYPDPLHPNPAYECPEMRLPP